MSTDADTPQPYELNLSVEVYAKLLELATTARDRGDGERYLAALKEFHRRLRVYPQFGDPLVDLVHQSGHIRIGIIPPLSMWYAVLEEQRLVFVTVLPVLLPKAADGTG